MRLVLSFLTRIPVGDVRSDDYFRDLGRGAPLFPLAGLVVGGVAAAVEWLTRQVLGGQVSAVAAIAASVLVTGALHLDGLMDTADGVMSHRSRERMLEIMRDSRVGAMGVIAAVLAMLMRFALLGATPPTLRWQALLVAPALGRAALVISARLHPAARAGNGLGAGFAAHVSPAGAWLALAVGALAAVAFGGVRGGIAIALAALAALPAAAALSRTLGGLTGDTYGAINELTELAALAAFAASLTGV